MIKVLIFEYEKGVAHKATDNKFNLKPQLQNARVFILIQCSPSSHYPCCAGTSRYEDNWRRIEHEKNPVTFKLLPIPKKLQRIFWANAFISKNLWCYICELFGK